MKKLQLMFWICFISGEAMSFLMASRFGDHLTTGLGRCKSFPEHSSALKAEGKKESKTSSKGKGDGNGKNKGLDVSDETKRMVEFLEALDPRKSDALLEYSIDSFLRGDYDGTFADDAAAPLPGLSPKETLEAALYSLRDLDEPEPAHGAAVFQRFCLPLSRAERWAKSRRSEESEWKDIMRGTVTPMMLSGRIRASKSFSPLLDWKELRVSDVTAEPDDLMKVPDIARVSATLCFEDELMANETIIFQLCRYNGVWMIDFALKHQPRDSKILRRNSNDSEQLN